MVYLQKFKSVMESYESGSVTGDERHLVLCDVSAKDCWLERYEGNLNFKLEFMFMEKASPEIFLQWAEVEMKKTDTPLCLSLSVLSSTLPALTIDDVKRFLKDVDLILSRFPFHRVAIAEVMFAPKDRDYFDLILETNTLIGEFNEAHGFSRYALSNVGMKSRKKGPLSAAEISTKWNQWTGGKVFSNRRVVATFLRKFHLMNFLPQPLSRATEGTVQTYVEPKPTPCSDIENQTSSTCEVDDTEVSQDDNSIIEIIEESVSESSEDESSEFNEEIKELRKIWTAVGKENGWLQEAENRGYQKAITVLVKALNEHEGPYREIPLAKRLKTIKDLGSSLNAEPVSAENPVADHPEDAVTTEDKEDSDKDSLKDFEEEMLLAEDNLEDEFGTLVDIELEI